MESLTPVQRVVVTIVVVILTLIAVVLLLPLLNRTIEMWLQRQATPSPTPAASPTATAAWVTSGMCVARVAHQTLTRGQSRTMVTGAPTSHIAQRPS